MLSSKRPTQNEFNGIFEHYLSHNALSSFWFCVFMVFVCVCAIVCVFRYLYMFYSFGFVSFSFLLACFVLFWFLCILSSFLGTFLYPNDRKEEYGLD